MDELCCRKEHQHFGRCLCLGEPWRASRDQACKAIGLKGLCLLCNLNRESAKGSSAPPQILRGAEKTVQEAENGFDGCRETQTSGFAIRANVATKWVASLQFASGTVPRMNIPPKKRNTPANSPEMPPKHRRQVAERRLSPTPLPGDHGCRKNWVCLF